MAAKAIRMFTSNKKRAVGASVFMLVEFLSLFIRWIARRSLYDSYSVLVLFSKPFLNSPASIYAKALHFSWWRKQRRLFHFYCPFRSLSVKCAFSHAFQQIYLLLYHIPPHNNTPLTHLWAKHKFVDALSFLFHFSYKRIRV